jgi:hypothetical protein
VEQVGTTARTTRTTTGRVMKLFELYTVELLEKWSKKYKKSINCSNPKGFSQRAHCAGRRKRASK